MRSKAYWGYDETFLAACRDELSVDAGALADSRQCWRIAEDGDTALGYYGLVLGDGDAELEALFITPEAIGTGLGRRLVEDAQAQARERAVSRIVIQGDPHAEAFYLAVGARKVGRRVSGSIPGRFLPLFELDCTT